MAPSLLIVGGGLAGTFLAKDLTKAGYDVTIVDRKDFFDVTFASLRASIDPEFAKSYMFEFAKIPGIGKVIQARVSDLTGSQATLDNGAVVKFDYCVLCTGSTNKAGVYGQPTLAANNVATRKSELLVTSEAIKAAKSIVIVGAGATGIELAAEIVDYYAGKKVTLVTSGLRLAPQLPTKVGDSSAAWLKGHGVEVLYSEMAKEGSSDKSVVLKSGKELAADLVVWTIGAKPNTEWLANTAVGGALNDSGFVKVTPDLRVVGFDNIFAIGDINSVDEPKMGYLAQAQSKHTAANFKALLKNSKAALKPYALWGGGPKAGFFSLGRRAGTGAMGSCVFPSCMVTSVKSKDVFVGKIRGDLGVK